VIELHALASPTPGSNAPLNDGCKNSSQPGANAVAAYDAWMFGGFPPSKLILGLPSYGYVSDSDAANLRSRSPSRALKHGRRRSLDGSSGEPPSTVKVTGEDGSSTVQFRDLVWQGALVRANSENTSPAVYYAAGGYTRYWDACSSTPWLRSTSAKQIITFDDPESLHMKAEFAKKVGMLGVNMFDVHGDTDEWDLIRAVRLGLGNV
jgi:chitinase